MVSVSGESPHSARKVIVPLRRSRSTTSAACSRTLTAGAWMCCSDSSSSGLGSSALAASAANCVEADADQHLGQQAGEPLLQPDRPRVPPRLPRQPLLEHGRDLLERAVLQEPGEEQVARLEQREVLLVLDVALRQQPGGLQVEQGRRRPAGTTWSARGPTSAVAAPALTCAMNSSVTRRQRRPR